MSSLLTHSTSSDTREPAVRVRVTLEVRATLVKEPEPAAGAVFPPLPPPADSILNAVPGPSPSPVPSGGNVP